MKIISFSDVITNSSSEVFVYYTQESINQVKRLIDAILKAGGNNKTCDDLFDIRLTFDEEYTRDMWFDQGNEEEPTNEQLLEFAKEYDSGLDVGDSSCIDGFEVIPKDPNNQTVASLITSIPFIFDTEAYFNY